MRKIVAKDGSIDHELLEGADLSRINAALDDLYVIDPEGRNKAGWSLLYFYQRRAEIRKRIRENPEAPFRSMNKESPFKRDGFLDNYFGGSRKNVYFKSNKYFTFKHVLNEDTIIIITSNVKVLKGYPILVTAKDQGLFLKNWQLQKVLIQLPVDRLAEGYLVKLNRKYFKPVSLRFTFDDIEIEEVETFDDLKKIAEEQDGTFVRLRSTI